MSNISGVSCRHLLVCNKIIIVFSSKEGDLTTSRIKHKTCQIVAEPFCRFNVNLIQLVRLCFIAMYVASEIPCADRMSNKVSKNKMTNGQNVQQSVKKIIIKGTMCQMDKVLNIKSQTG